MIKAIETKYKGYRFRSRLEARWAVFFDRCKEHWIYEDQGFWLSSGPYLPDFFFPKRKAFVEVKPISQLPINHFERLPFESRPINDVDFSSEFVRIYELSVALNLAAEDFVIVYGDPLDVLPQGDGGAFCLDRHGLKTGLGFLSELSIFDAAEFARSARFEHGEAVA